MHGSLRNTNYALTQEQIAAYRRDGFIQLNNVLTGDDLQRFRNAVADAVAAEAKGDTQTMAEKTSYEQVFIQKVNLWRRHPAVKEFVLCRRFVSMAAQLSGFPVRLWHEHALFKEPRQGKRTPWHQDAVYWPHENRDHQLSLWFALRDATIQNGCMSFIPGSQTIRIVKPIDLGKPQDIFNLAPDLKKTPPQTCELKAGACTFHNGMTFHYAGPNRSDWMRAAIAIIYMPDGTTYSGKKHVVTDGQGFQVGQKLEGELFPLLAKHCFLRSAHSQTISKACFTKVWP